MFKWLKNRAVEIEVEEKIAKENAEEKRLLLEQEEQLNLDLTSQNIPYELVQSITLNERKDLIVFATENGTLPLRLSNDRDLLYQMNYLFPYEFVEYLQKDQIFQFKLNITFKGFSRFLPTLPIMRLEGNSYVWFTLDLAKIINVKEIRYFADVVVGKETIAQDDLTYQSVLTNTLRYYSQKFGITLKAPLLEEVNLKTSLFTQIAISPKKEVFTIKPLRVLLSEFYHKDLEIKIKEYVEKIVNVMAWEKEFQRFQNVVDNILKTYKYDQYFKVEYHKVLSNTFSFILIRNDLKLPIVSFDVDYYLIRYKNTSDYFKDLIENGVLEAISKSLQIKYKLLTKSRKLKISNNFQFNIGGDISFNLANLSLVEACLDMENFLINEYGYEMAKNVRFSLCEGFDIHKGWIGLYVQDWETVKRAYLVPLQNYSLVKYASEWPSRMVVETRTEWCNHVLTIDKKKNKITCTLGTEVIEAKFKDGLRIFSY
ncbi:hypothetical protein [Lysinibacillus sp. K60]|uniref:hypothetical protein n=1 Tax=Lysinibacillus sp. K60 TaxID=2720027 RepID=UPI001C8BE705|nr:hypothetical protein [Lysinibacillus sp. K60]MBX8946022.1 hypothetical protein [Lysinibacillus sp. K60]